MNNLIRSQLYQLKKKKSIYYLFFGMLALIFLVEYLNYLDLEKQMTASYFLTYNSNPLMIMPMLFVIFLTGMICGEDFMDKTINYELMGGHSRAEIYLSRVLLSLGLSLPCYLILSAVPVAILAGILGWGNTLKLSALLTRYLLTLLPMLRIICEMIALNYLIKNTYIVIAFGTIITIYGGGLMDSGSGLTSSLLGITNLVGLFQMESFRLYSLSVYREYIIYDAALQPDTVIATIAASVVFGTLALWIGYVYFHRDDLS